MLLKMNIYDKASRSKGTVRMRLDFDRNKWSIEQDFDQAWKYVGHAENGTFDVKTDNHVIWIWDYDNFGGRHNPVIIWDAPETEDSSKTLGRARMFDPQDKAYKDCIIAWLVEVSPIAASKKESSSTELTPIREKVLSIIEGIPFDYFPKVQHKFPNGPPSKALKEKTAQSGGSANGNAAEGGGGVNETKVTNCGEFPGWIVNRLGGSGLPKDIFKIYPEPKWKGSYAITAPMTGWDIWAKKIEKEPSRKGKPRIWIDRTKGILPKPGDFYILTMKANKVEFAHVGVFVEDNGGIWKTADTGQPSPTPGDPEKPSGFTGCYEKRIFKDSDDSVELKLPGVTLTPDVGVRYLKGWIDLDSLFAGWKP